jgi:hypothetical protein
MLFSHFQYGFNRTVAVAFLLIAVSGCEKGVSPPQTKRTVTFDCGNQTVGVVTGTGTSPKAVYLCGGDTLTWIPNGQKFTVTFRKEYPFTGALQTFTNNPANPDAPVTSPPAKYTGSLVVYHYEISINGTPVDDPQVVGGGGYSSSP